MKKLAALALLLCAAAARGQEAYSAQKSDFAVEKNGGLVVPSGYLTIKDETTARAQQSTLTFLGSAVSCVDNAGNFATECTISTASGYSLVRDEATPLTARANLTFLGAGVTCVDDAGADLATECTIPGGAGAPSDADYLVGTANGSLSAEIVVGATPGGELGNTWASPTIDDSLAVTSWNLTTSTGTGGFSLTNGATGPGFLYFLEDSDNGSNTVQLIGPASTADVVLTLPAVTGTVLSTGTDVTLAQIVPATAASVLLGRGSAGGAGDFQEVTLGSGLAMTSQVLSTKFDPSTTVEERDEFTGPRASATSTCAAMAGWQVTNVATGANNGCGTAVLSGDTTWRGVVNYRVAAVADVTTLNRCTTAAFGCYLVNGNEIRWRVRFEDLSVTASEGYIFKAGFGDSVAATDPTDGVWFSYTDNVNSGNWVINAKNNAGPTTGNTSTAVAADTWYELKIICNSGGTSCNFYVNGTEVANSPLAANIPNVSGRETTPFFQLQKTVGSTARDIYLDYYYLVGTR